MYFEDVLAFMIIWLVYSYVVNFIYRLGNDCDNAVLSPLFVDLCCDWGSSPGDSGAALHPCLLLLLVRLVVFGTDKLLTACTLYRLDMIT